MKITPTRYTYFDIVEFSLYSDLKAILKADDKIVLQSNQEYTNVIETLKEIDIPHFQKSKREIIIISTNNWYHTGRATD